KRLLVTGGRGRLASLIADHFGAPAYATALYSRTPAAGLLSLGQLLDTTNWKTADTILHLAWSTLPSTSEKNPGSGQRHDWPSPDRRRAVRPRPPSGRVPHLIFFAAGGAVYGDAGDRPSREDDRCHPTGNYVRAKLTAEQRFLAAA